MTEGQICGYCGKMTKGSKYCRGHVPKTVEHKRRIAQSISRGLLGNKRRLGYRFSHTEETKHKIHLALLGKNRIGHPQTEETRRKISIGHSRPVGATFMDRGYKRIKTAKKSWKREHRHIIEQHLGRKLHSNESVHHKNEVQSDNRVENLMLFISESAHQRYHKNPLNVRLEEIIFDGGTL